MRGQTLYIRPIEAADLDEIGRFLDSHGVPERLPANGLLGRLVGDLVAVLAMEITEDYVKVTDIVVARHLRRKRIGRLMLDELEQLAAKMDRGRMVVDGAGDAQEFFQRVGFARIGESLVRRVRVRRQR